MTVPATARPTASRRPARARWAGTEPLEGRRLLSGTTYYVSNAGSDTNPGTSQAQPWQTAAMVDATSFQPGDTILFQRGGQWREDLTASSDGAAGNPITYGAYGDPAAAKPLFTGSDVLDPASFALVTGNTYSVAHAGAVHWVFDNGAFTHEATDALAQSGSATSTDPAAELAYVEATPGTFTYDATSTTLYVNLGGPPAGHVIEAAVRDDAVYSNAHSHLVFSGLTTSQTADDNAGYGFRLQGGTDVTVTNCDATEAGKHNFGFIDIGAVVAQGLTGSLGAPDQGFGGASMVAFFNDSGSSSLQHATGTFTDLTWANPGGAYPILISHGSGTAPFDSIAMTNLVSTGGFGTGIYAYDTASSPKVTLTGGSMTGAVIVYTPGAVIDGVTFTGTYANVELTGSAEVVQNCLFTNINPNFNYGRRSAVIDDGTNDVVRFNTFSWTASSGSAIDVTASTVSSTIQGNVFDCPLPIWLQFDSGTPTLTSDYNLFQPGSTIEVGSASPGFYTLAEWQGGGYDAHSVGNDPVFNDSATGDYTLDPSSPAIDLVAGSVDQSTVPLTADLAGNPRPYGAGYDAGAYEYQHPATVIVGTFSVTGPASVPEATAGSSTSATFTITLSAPLTTVASVGYATVNGTAYAGTSYTAATGTVTFAPGETTRAVRVVITTTGTDVGTTFSLKLSHPSVGTRIVGEVASATVPAQPPTAFAVDRRLPQSFTDGNARPVRIVLAGPGVVTVYRGSAGGDALELLLSGTNATSSLTITATGGHTPIAVIDVVGSLGRLSAATVDLTANLNVTGTIGSITLGNVTGPADVTIGGAKARPALAFGAVSDLAVTSAAPLASVTAASWGAPAYGTIAAPSVGTLRVAGPFAASLALSSPGVGLTSASLGNVTDGTWAIAGRAGAVSAKSTASSWSATVGGALASLTTAGTMSGSLTAASVGNLRVGKDLSGATVTLNGAAGRGFDLSTLRVGGAITASVVRSTGSINSVTAGAIQGSTVFAGVDPTIAALPTAATDFAASAVLGAFTVAGIKGSATGVSASNVAAATLGHVRVVGVQTANGGTPFGFASHTLAGYTDLEAGKKAYVWTGGHGAPTTAGDYKVSIL